MPLSLHPKMTNQILITGASVFGVILILFGLAISVITIYTDNNAVVDSSVACQLFPNVTSFSLEKQLTKQWHWEYDFNEFNGYVRMKCPTTQYDAALYLNNQLVSFVDGKIVTVVSKAYINDCHGNTIYVTQSADLWQEYINGNKIWVSYLLKDSSGTNILAYVDGNHFWGDSIDIKASSDGHIVANMYKKPLTFTWHFTIYDPFHYASDGRILSLIAIKKSFGVDDKSTDICNSYFSTVSIILIVIASLIGLCVLLFIAFCFKETFKL